MKPNIILMVGPPGSGKSTYASNMMHDGKRLQKPEYFYINQDTQGKDHLRLFNEALQAKSNVIIDRMGFNKIQRERYLKPAIEAGYSTEIIVLHESHEICLRRCLARTDHATIKDEKDARNALDTFFSKYERVEDSEANKVTRLWQQDDKMKPTAVVFDLDGTMCNVDHRLHFMRPEKGKKKNWKGFFDGIIDDSVNEWCHDLASILNSHFSIVYCSGRPDTYRKNTLDWFEKNGIRIRPLFMRHRNDSRRDDIVKEIILDFEILSRYKPHFFVDDRTQVVEMYRKRGFTVLQCERGDF